jgi:hypothetical protein
MAPGCSSLWRHADFQPAIGTQSNNQANLRIRLFPVEKTPECQLSSLPTTPAKKTHKITAVYAHSGALRARAFAGSKMHRA